MHTVTFDFLGQHCYGTAFQKYLRLRKRTFVDMLNWDIPHNDDVEMDQYDNPCAHYALLMQGAEVVGGARVMPTTSCWGQHRYMLIDARRGKLKIPQQVMSEDIETDMVWEITRLVISECAKTYAERSECLSAVLSAAVGLVREQGGSELISLSPVSLARTLNQLGFPAQRVGEPFRDPDGRKYAMLRMPTIEPTVMAAA